MATALYSKPKLVDFILSEANGQRSRENIVVTQAGAAILSGTVLARAAAGSAAFEMSAGATGNPTSGDITVSGAAQAGNYVIEFTAATKFTVEAPDGTTVGTGTLGTAFAKGGLGFTLTAGATPAVAGDIALVAVTLAGSAYVPYQAAGAAGPAVAVLYSHLPAATGNSKAVGFVRACEVKATALTGSDAAAVANLASAGIVVRADGAVGTIATPAL